MERPPTSPLLLLTAMLTSAIERLYARSFVGSTVIWYCFTKPPMDATSDTPSTAVSWYLRYQSCMERSSARLRCLELIAYINAQPTPVASGPRLGATPGGSRDESELKYSSTRLRAQYGSVPSAKIT